MRVVVVNETERARASENADVNVEAKPNAAAKNSCARRRAHGDRARPADGLGRLDRGTPPASSLCHRLFRRVGLRIGGLYRPRPFPVCHRHDCRTRFSFRVYHPHRPSFVCHCRRIPCHHDNFAVCPAPSILGGPGTRRVIRGLRCVGSPG